MNTWTRKHSEVLAQSETAITKDGLVASWEPEGADSLRALGAKITKSVLTIAPVELGDGVDVDKVVPKSGINIPAPIKAAFAAAVRDGDLVSVFVGPKWAALKIVRGKYDPDTKKFVPTRGYGPLGGVPLVIPVPAGR